MDVTTSAVDLAGEVFEGAGAMTTGHSVEHRRLNRLQFQRFLRNPSKGTEIVMEAWTPLSAK